MSQTRKLAILFSPNVPKEDEDCLIFAFDEELDLARKQKPSAVVSNDKKQIIKKAKEDVVDKLPAGSVAESLYVSGFKEWQKHKDFKRAEKKLNKIANKEMVEPSLPYKANSALMFSQEEVKTEKNIPRYVGFDIKP